MCQSVLLGRSPAIAIPSRPDKSVLVTSPLAGVVCLLGDTPKVPIACAAFLLYLFHIVPQKYRRPQELFALLQRCDFIDRLTAATASFGCSFPAPGITGLDWSSIEAARHKLPLSRRCRTHRLLLRVHIRDGHSLELHRPSFSSLPPSLAAIQLRRARKPDQPAPTILCNPSDRSTT